MCAATAQPEARCGPRPGPPCWGPGRCVGRRPLLAPGPRARGKRRTRPSEGSRAAVRSCPRLWKPGPLSSAAVEVLTTSQGRGALCGWHPSAERAGDEPRSEGQDPGRRKQRKRAIPEVGRAAGPRPPPDQALGPEPAALKSENQGALPPAARPGSREWPRPLHPSATGPGPTQR